MASTTDVEAPLLTVKTSPGPRFTLLMYVEGVVAIVAFVVVVYVIVGGNTKASTAFQTSSTMNTFGSEKDKYGCSISAGYSWCDTLKTCYRPWEIECKE